MEKNYHDIVPFAFFFFSGQLLVTVRILATFFFQRNLYDTMHVLWIHHIYFVFFVEGDDINTLLTNFTQLQHFIY